MRICALRQVVVAGFTTLLVTATFPAVCSATSENSANEQQSVAATVPASNDASPDVVVEGHQVSVTFEQQQQQHQMQVSEASGRDIEKERLLSVMSRNHGTWSSNHPRYRLLDALHGFAKYYERQREDTDRLRGLYKHVSGAQRKFLEEHVSYSSKFKKVEQRLAHNQHVCDDIVQASLQFYNIGMNELQEHMRDREAEGRQADKISISQSLKHIVRDWTEEGSHERDKPFACLLGTLQRLFTERSRIDKPVKILLPGAGLGRLGHDISHLGGFEVTINEWSMFMNTAYRFLETQTRELSQSVSPFVDGWSHHATDANMQRGLRFPDVPIQSQNVLLVEGDFTTEFKNYSQHYDVVLTYFFIDTARNLMSYFDTIKYVLKRGGVWINLGPLLYGTGPFVQLSLEDIVTVSENMGFEFLETEEQCGVPTFGNPTVRSIKAAYQFDHKALTENAYSAQFWVARKL
ncbi:hypothetical protein QQS21_003698 [Conoideocrella luteorostrata]|uniref:N2227-like protein n=1 Tax=Conoideocrella luteorostrata TaxID=1105319 RepID=A0AAJ0CTP1_9HYPO|nr:hypothetical protein QQS21_003698 [Conoideocrella luteorostrata]